MKTRQYHIGKEIEEEVRKQYPSIDIFAKALHRERQTVYDIFKRGHIATDRLMEISKLLHRDFFLELSNVYKNGGQENEEDEKDEKEIAEQLGQLAEGDAICIKTTEQVCDIADEFYLTKRTRPLLVFYDNGTNPVIDTMKKVATLNLGEGMVKSIVLRKSELMAFESSIPNLADLPQMAIHLMCIDVDCDNALLMAEKLIKASGKFVVVFYQCMNKLYADANRRIGYRSTADSCFSSWKKRVNMFVADDHSHSFARTRELYNASKYPACGILDRINFLLGQNMDDEARLVLQEAKSSPIIHSYKEEDVRDGITRIHITTLILTKEEESIMKETFCKPLLSMWIDVYKESGHINDWEQSIANIIMSI